MTTALALPRPFSAWPAAIATASKEAQFSILQFFAAEIANPNTRRTYLRGAMDFFDFVGGMPGGDQLGALTALHVAAWRQDLEVRGLSVPTVKNRIAGLRKLFEALVRTRIIAVNPAATVSTPRHSVARGKTPVLTGEEMAALLAAIDTDTLIGLRDRALIGCMGYSFGRIGAVLALTVGDVFVQRRRLWLRLREKRGRVLEIPCHHAFENFLMEWLERSGLRDTPSSPLFPSFAASAARPFKDRVLSGRALRQSEAWAMVRRRARMAGIRTPVCNHTFRATGITAYLANGGTIERAASIAGHASTRTTQLYDRRPDDVTLDEIEKIRFE